MQIPAQITFRHMTPSVAVEADIRSWIDKLEEYSQRITSCRVVVESPHQHHRQGQLYRVRVALDVPGEPIIGGRSSDEHHSHEDVYVAIRDAFRGVRRRLEEQTRRVGERADRRAS